MTCDRAEIRAVLLALIGLAVAILAGCGPSHVTVPDTAPPLQPPPESAMRACPTAENQGTGTGYLPDVEDGTRGALIRAATTAAGYGRTCVQRHRTLREWINDALQRQREAAMAGSQ